MVCGKTVWLGVLFGWSMAVSIGCSFIQRPSLFNLLVLVQKVSFYYCCLPYMEKVNTNIWPPQIFFFKIQWQRVPSIYKGWSILICILSWKSHLWLRRRPSRTTVACSGGTCWTGSSWSSRNARGLELVPCRSGSASSPSWPPRVGASSGNGLSRSAAEAFLVFWMRISRKMKGKLAGVIWSSG